MNNSKILENRWKKTDRKLREIYPELKKVYADLIDEIIETVSSTGTKRDVMRKKVPQRLRRKVLNKISAWMKNGLYKDYLAYRCAALKWTYADVIDLLILGIYFEAAKKTVEISNEVFYYSANDVYSQARNDLKKIKPILVPEILTWTMITKYLEVPVVYETYETYIYSLAAEFAGNMKNRVFTIISQNGVLIEKDLTKLVIKQTNRILCINRNKFSGSLDNTVRSMGNQVYFDPFPNQKVRFIAELDEHTTPMCLSLDGQIFNTKDENVFIRYSASHKQNIRYRTQGLQTGINLPPITDHFHWCRSTIMYVE